MSTGPNTQQSRKWTRFIYFFPFQLLILHLKKNHFLLLMWLLLYAITFNMVATKYGVAYLFLAPEYQGDLSFISFAIFGFSLGGFFLAFNLYSYIMHGYRFTFILTLERPFVKFSINNFIIPLLFLGIYCAKSIRFQSESELIPAAEIALNMLGLMAGILLFHVISSVYFISTNKSFLAFRKEAEEEGELAVDTVLQHTTTAAEDRTTWRVETYLSNYIRIRLARKSTHYERRLTERVLAQNHINASLFELALIISFFFIGSLGEKPLFEIPAAASLVLLLTVSLMLYSALYSWFKGWTLTLFAGIILFINYQTANIEFLYAESRAYGLSYSGERAVYDFNHNTDLSPADSVIRSDFQLNLEVLEKWRIKNQHHYIRNGGKPKLIVLCTSGGGSRSALWTANCLMKLDSLSKGRLLNQTQFMTGSSGGMIGAAYVREIYRQHLVYPDSVRLYDPVHFDRLSKDLLNPMLFRVATNDLFIRYQKFRLDDEVYTKDRGYAFERQLNENTEGILWKRLGDYRYAEESGLIPTMVLSPTIVNDGRRMLIASRPVSFLTNSSIEARVYGNLIQEDVEFSRLFSNQRAEELLMTSALRMNATFPLIMPTVSLPSTPTLEVMDAGLRDNFGVKTALEYLHTFRNWISSNTSGVIILQIRDKQKDFPSPERDPSLFSRFAAPLGSVYGNYTRMQDLNHEQLIAYFETSVDYPLNVIDFELEQDPDDLISLSWHLTRVEKERVLNSLNLPKNQNSTSQLLKLLEK